MCVCVCVYTSCVSMRVWDSLCVWRACGLHVRVRVRVCLCVRPCVRVLDNAVKQTTVLVRSAANICSRCFINPSSVPLFTNNNGTLFLAKHTNTHTHTHAHRRISLVIRDKDWYFADIKSPNLASIKPLYRILDCFVNSAGCRRDKQDAEVIFWRLSRTHHDP